MILIDNRNVLRLKNRELLNQISKWDDRQSTGQVVVEQAKTGVPTIKIIQNGKTQYLQSKYDPQKEAERFASKFTEESVNHVLFVGIGTGYHIQEIMKIHPNTKFAIYEPNEEVLHAYLSKFSLDHLPLQNLLSIFTGLTQESILSEIQKILVTSNNVLKIITLPAYENVYGEQIYTVLEKALESVKEKHNSLATNVSFQKRWTINSIKNFPTILQTPNILHDVDKSAFKDKPAIIVAAGPSLNEEFENLRYIKEHGLAYIFSVGSAINALIEHGIYPDAACTYDPTLLNQKVIKRIKEDQITDIPLIFGSSVGFETLENYPGKMFHMITSQDTIAPILLSSNEEINTVLDAPSIAVVTFQLLTKLGCNPIILVGQNQGYQNQKRYASGINYDFIESNLSESEIEKALMVKDVYGTDIQTNDGFNRMRQQLELYIKASSTVKVINTTKGGAQIEGTEFIELEELIGGVLSEKVINPLWIQAKNTYDVKYVNKEIKSLMSSSKEFLQIINESILELKSIQQAINLNKTKNMESRFTQFDNVFGKLKKNIYYTAFIEPMVRVQYGRLLEDNKSFRFETDASKKGEAVVQSFGSFIQECSVNYQLVQPFFLEMNECVPGL